MTNYDAIKKKLQDTRDQAQRAQGQLDAALAELRKLGFETVEAAQAALAQAQQKRDAMEAQIAQAITEYQAKYGPLL